MLFTIVVGSWLMPAEPVVPRAKLLFTCNVPSSIVTGPAKVLLPDKTKFPKPFLVTPPAMKKGAPLFPPPIEALMLKVEAALVMVKNFELVPRFRLPLMLAEVAAPLSVTFPPSVNMPGSNASV